MMILLFLVFGTAWYLPVYLKQGKKNKLPGKTYIKALALGLIPSFVIGVVFSSIIGWIMKWLHIEGLLKTAISTFIGYGVAEEFAKYLMGKLALKGCGEIRKIDSILIYGAVGVGFQVTESLLVIGSSIAGPLIRGILALHIAWQFWMGAHLWEADRCHGAGDEAGAKKNHLLAILLPMIFHGFHDFSGDALQLGIENGTDKGMLLGLIPFILALIIDIVFIIKTIRMVNRTAKESREAEEELA